MTALPDRIRELGRPLERLREEIDEAFDRWGIALRHQDDGQDDTASQTIERRRFHGPALDVEESGNEVVVRAELPGVQPDDVTVEVSGDRLIFRGEKTEERSDRSRGFYRVERRYGAFQRAVRLPTEVDPERASAQYRNGVLTVTLPKPESAKSRRVKINPTK